MERESSVVERLQPALDALPVAAYVCDRDGLLLHCNVPAVSLFGRTPAVRDPADRYCGALRLFTPDSVPVSRERSWTAVALQQGHAVAGESILERPDGTRRSLHVHVDLVRDAAGAVAGAFTVLIDVTDQVRALGEHAAARRSAEDGLARLRTVVANLADGIVIGDLNGNLLEWNPAALRLYGYTSQDEVRRHLDTFADDFELSLPDGTRLPFAEWPMPRLLRGDKVVNYEVRSLRRDAGLLRIVRYDGAVVADPASGPPLVLLSMHDLTSERRAERDLHDSEERYRRLVELLPDAMYINDGDRIAFCNPAMVRLVGAPSAATLVGTRVLDWFPAEYHQRVRARVAAIRATGQAVPPMEYRLQRADGRLVPVSVLATPILESGSAAILVVVHDLTEREQSLELLRAVMASVADAFVTVDERGVIASVNPAVERLFGHDADSLIGQPALALVPAARRDAAAQQFELLRQGGAGLLGKSHEVQAQRRDGSTFPAELTVTEFPWNGARHFAGVVRDITQRKLLEQQFLQAHKMEAVGQLAGGVAHDFNNLLTVIRGYCDVLDGEPTALGRAESVSAIRGACERAARLTRQLLAFSRRAIVEPRLLDLNMLLSDAEQLLRRLIGEDIVLRVVVDQEACLLLADVGQLEQVVMNLALNARDAMPTGGTLTLATRHVSLEAAPGGTGPPAGRYVELTVADTGTGMSAEVRSRVFQPFFTTKPVGQGSGLGLAVVHGVVQQCGGHIHVQSQLGAGTTFRLLFPASTASLAAAVGTGEVAARGSETVMLVEDEPEVRRIARQALERHGYTVLEAGSPVDAVRLAGATTNAIDLLITDVVMPGIDGRQVVDAVRQRRPDVRVLYVSGYTDDAIVRRGVDAASVSFLQKPFAPQDLVRKVRTVLDAPPPS